MYIEHLRVELENNAITIEIEIAQSTELDHTRLTLCRQLPCADHYVAEAVIDSFNMNHMLNHCLVKSEYASPTVVFVLLPSPLNKPKIEQ